MKKTELLKLAWDRYGRYALTASFIEKTRFKRPLRILDVGGGQEDYLSMFLPSDKIIVLDKEKTDLPNHIVGNALNMPFKDGEYDVVVSEDVLEHIPEKSKLHFLNELFRVAKNYIIIAAPFYSKEVQKAEERVNSFHQLLSGEKDKNLIEHKRYGLPKTEMVEAWLKNKKLAFFKISHNYLPFWEDLMRTTFLVRFNSTLYPLLEKLYIWYNKNVYPMDRAEPSYRKIYFISKEGKAIDFLKEPDKKGLEGSDEKIKIYVAKILSQALKEKQAQIQEKEAQIQEKENQIREIYRSYSWRIGHFIIKILFPFYQIFQKLIQALRKQDEEKNEKG